MKICELMSRASIRYAPQDSLKSVIKTMTKEQHSCGIICQDGTPVGIVTERDLVRFMNSEEKLGDINLMTIAEVMTPNPICVTANTEISSALDLARSHNLRHLPVVDESNEFTGIVTLTDLIKALSTMHKRNAGLASENTKLRVLAVEDPLTGLPNRRAMEVDIFQTAAVASRQRRGYALALIDIDYFKNYNDHYGHPAGDTALCQVAGVLDEGRRKADRLYRYGGEEFLLLMPFTDTDGALVAVSRLISDIQNEAIPHIKSPFEVITISAGIGVCRDQLPWEEVLNSADEALYCAKDAGRNQHHLSPLKMAVETETFLEVVKTENKAPRLS